MPCQTAKPRSPSRAAASSAEMPSTEKANVGTRPSIAGSPWSRIAGGSPARNRSPERRAPRRRSPPSRATRRTRPPRRSRRAARTASVPVSKRLPSGSIGAGRTLYGRHDSSRSRRPNAIPRCGPKNLYGEQIEHVDAERGDVDRPVRARSGRRRPRRSRRPRARDRRSGGRRSACPTAFEATGKATTRVRSESCRSRSSRSSVVSSLMSTKRTVRSRSCASSSQGETFASWSSFVHEDLVARPELAADRAREREVERRHVRAEDDVVPGASRGSAPRVSRARSSSASVRRLVS